MLDPSVVIALWIPIAALTFAFLRPARALILAYLVAVTCLPVGAISIQGFFDLDKQRATAAAVLVGLALFRTRELAYYRFCWADLWFALFCGGAVLSAVSNGLGLYEGFSHAGTRAIDFGFPYLAGRLCIRSDQDLYDVGRAVFLAAVIYTLPALWEWRMSPQLHTQLYGYFQHAFYQFHRWGYFRPVVCMRHALDLGMFFATASLLGIWLARARKLPSVHGIPSQVLIGVTLVGLLTSMSIGPWSLFLLALAILLAWDKLRWRWMVVLPTVISCVWIGARFQGAAGKVATEASVAIVAHVAPDRAESLEYRLETGKDITAGVKRRLWLGWGRWGGGRGHEDTDRRWRPIDALWLIVLGTSGLFGLITFYLWWCWPVLQSVRRPLVGGWATLGFVIITSMYAVFYLFNGFPTPIVIMAMGGITGVQRHCNAVQPLYRPHYRRWISHYSGSLGTTSSRLPASRRFKP